MYIFLYDKDMDLTKLSCKKGHHDFILLVFEFSFSIPCQTLGIIIIIYDGCPSHAIYCLSSNRREVKLWYSFDVMGIEHTFVS